MTPYKNKEEMTDILTTLWTRIFAAPEIVKSVSGVKLVARFRYTDYGCALYIDLSGETPRFCFDPSEPVEPDVDMILSSETSHLFWMQDLNVPLAIATRKIVAKGSIQKALKLLPALKPAFALYPPVLREHGRGDLLTASPKARKRVRAFSRGIRAFFGKTSSPIDASRIPAFPMTFSDGASCLATPSSGDRRHHPEKARKRFRAFLQPCTPSASSRSTSRRRSRRVISPPRRYISPWDRRRVAAGVCLTLRDSDYLNTTHRGHGHIIAKGADLDRMMAEIYGRRDGLCGGRGGSMHVTDGAKGVLGANGIVGAGYLLAMGAGFTIKKLKRDDISVGLRGRRLRQPGHVPRGHEHDLGLQPPGARRHGKQPLRRVHLARAPLGGHGALQARRRPTTSRRSASTATTRAPSSTKPEGRRDDARGREAAPPGAHDLPVARPHGGRAGALPHRGGKGKIHRRRSRSPASKRNFSRKAR